MARLAQSLCLTLLLAGCATRPAYWVKVAEPVNPSVWYLDDPDAYCKAWAGPVGSTMNGCFYRSNRVLIIRANLPEGKRQCVTKHEYKHAAGWDHPHYDHEPAYGIDCGDGTIWPAN